MSGGSFDIMLILHGCDQGRQDGHELAEARVPGYVQFEVARLARCNQSSDEMLTFLSVVAVMMHRRRYP